MEKDYHISVNGKNLGTFSLTEIQTDKLNPEAIAWREGMDDWKPVTDIDELKAYIKATPPPIPRRAKKKVIYAPGYLMMGLIGLGITIWMDVRSNFLSLSSYDHPVLISCIFLGLRFMMANIVAGTLKEYKRPSFGWAVFAFFLPSLSFICVAFVSPKEKR